MMYGQTIFTQGVLIQCGKRVWSQETNDWNAMQVMLCGTSSGSQKKEDIGGKEVEKF